MTKEAKENNIIRLNSRHHNSPICTRVEALWADLIQHRLPPRREDITAALLGPALPFAFVLDQPSQGGCRFRLAGDEVNRSIGMEMMTMSLTGLFHGSSRAQVQALVPPVFSEGAVLDLYLECQQGSGEGRLILLPLQPSRGRPRALGALEMFDVTAPLAGNLHIKGSCLTRARVETADDLVDPARGFAESPPPFLYNRQAGTKKPDAKRPALRLVQSGD